VTEELVSQSVELPDGALRVLQPREAAELPDAGAVEWAPVAPYWAVLWRSGVALARELGGAGLGGRRVVELGCGLAVPSLAAARAGATVLATDACPDALELVGRNADVNEVRVDTALVDWREPDELVARAPFDLVLAADVLYDRASVAPLLSLLPASRRRHGSPIPVDRRPAPYSRRRPAGGASTRASAAWSASTGYGSAVGRLIEPPGRCRAAAVRCRPPGRR
jgi:predicted nicotinamide N-methyase